MFRFDFVVLLFTSCEMYKTNIQLFADQHFSQKLSIEKKNSSREMNSLKGNVDIDRRASCEFVFSDPLSVSMCLENGMKGNTEATNINRKRKAVWEDGGIPKKKRVFWETQTKRQLFHTKSDKKNNNSIMLKTSKKAKALRRGEKGKLVDHQDLLSNNGSTNDQVKHNDFPSTSGNTHGKVKIIVQTKNNGPTRRVPAKKMKWTVSTIPLFFKDTLANLIKSSTGISIFEKENINNNNVPYPTSRASMDAIKSHWDTE